MPLILSGQTSGSTTLQPTDAVTTTLTLPSSTGTLATVSGNLGTPTALVGTNITGLTGAQGASAVLLGTATASNSASINFTGLSGTSYSGYVLSISGIVPSTNAVSFLLRISTGSGFLNSAYRHGTFRWTASATGVSGSTSDSQWVISSNSETCGTGPNQLSSYTVFINDTSATYPTKRATWSASGLWASGTYVYMQGGGEVDTQSVAVDGVQLLMSSGNIASGTISLYGIKNS